MIGILFADLGRVAQQVRPAFLLIGARNGVVLRPEVGNQNALEILDKKLRKRRAAARTIDHVKRRIDAGKALQLMRYAVAPPAGFVGVQLRGSQAVAVNFFVPGEENVGQAMPHLHQSAGHQFHSQMEVEGVDDLDDRQALQEMQECREDERAVAECAVGQHVGDFRLDPLLALRTIVAVDDILCHHAFEIFGNVFAKPFAPAATFLDGRVARRVCVSFFPGDQQPSSFRTAELSPTAGWLRLLVEQCVVESPTA